MTARAEDLRSRRRQFAAPGGSHDKLVRTLMRVLPAGVGVVAALMILAPFSPRGDISFLLDRKKVAITSERLRVDDAQYRGEDDEGRPFTLSAGNAVQLSARDPEVVMTNLIGRITLADGPARIVAPTGRYNLANETVAVSGPLSFVAADGYRLSATNVTVDLDSRTVVGSNGITGAIPAGSFSAERIVADLPARTVALAGRARLRMEPGKLRMP